VLHARTNHPEIRETFTSSPKIVALIDSLRKGGNTDTIVASALDAGDILKNPEAMEDAASIGKMLTAPISSTELIKHDFIFVAQRYDFQGRRI